MPRRTSNKAIRDIETAIENHVAGRIRLRRGLLGLSQSDLARSLDLTFQQVQKYERGTNRVSIGKLVRMAEILDVPLMFFFDGAVSANQLGAGEAGLQMSRLDLDLLRAWRAAPDEIKDAVLSLLRTVAHGDAVVSEETAEGEGEGAATAPAGRRRRKRGAVWDPADIPGR